MSEKVFKKRGFNFFLNSCYWWIDSKPETNTHPFGIWFSSNMSFASMTWPKLLKYWASSWGVVYKITTMLLTCSFLNYFLDTFRYQQLQQDTWTDSFPWIISAITFTTFPNDFIPKAMAITSFYSFPNPYKSKGT